MVRVLIPSVCGCSAGCRLDADVHVLFSDPNVIQASRDHRRFHSQRAECQDRVRPLQSGRDRARGPHSRLLLQALDSDQTGDRGTAFAVQLWPSRGEAGAGRYGCALTVSGPDKTGSRRSRGRQAGASRGSGNARGRCPYAAVPDANGGTESQRGQGKARPGRSPSRSTAPRSLCRSAIARCAAIPPGDRYPNGPRPVRGSVELGDVASPSEARAARSLAQ